MLDTDGQVHLFKGYLCVCAGGGVMEQLQQWRYFPAGSGEVHRAVERPPEQQEGEAQGTSSVLVFCHRERVKVVELVRTIFQAWKSSRKLVQ